jgi:hypothetical protein
MEKVDLEILVKTLNVGLDAQVISGRVLLDRLHVIDEDSRKTAAYLDHRYAPFYYHLGKYIKPKSVMEVGFDLGLLSASLLTSCKTVKLFFGYKSNGPNFIPTRLGKANIRLRFKGEANFYIGNTYDQEFIDIFSPNSWDLVILNDETVYDKHLEYLDAVWPNVSEHGLVIAEYIDRHAPAREAFLAFCESKNRQPAVFETRYGTGILQK